MTVQAARELFDEGLWGLRAPALESLAAVFRAAIEPFGAATSCESCTVRAITDRTRSQLRGLAFSIQLFLQLSDASKFKVKTKQAIHQLRFSGIDEQFAILHFIPE